MGILAIGGVKERDLGPHRDLYHVYSALWLCMQEAGDGGRSRYLAHTSARCYKVFTGRTTPVITSAGNEAKQTDFLGRN